MNFDFTKVMWTDSKYFTSNSSSGRIGHYTLTSAPPTTMPKPKRGASLHVYMGCTVFGLTELIIVTGGSKINKRYTMRGGSLYKGVCAAEYQDHVLPILGREGNRLFRSKHRRHWILQQDGARIHTAPLSLALAAKAAPGGLLHPWPANSPDLSIIENVWSMMGRKLALKPFCPTAALLETALHEVWGSIGAEDLQGLFDGIPSRLDDVIIGDGATVRF
jgi:hypothetical protein